MNLIYIDESGNTGNNLLDPEQPTLLMGALIVPEDAWLKLETSLMSLISNFFSGAVPEDFELHGTELRRGNGHFKGISVTKRIEFSCECLTIAKTFGLKFIYRRIIKAKYKIWHDKTCGTAIKINPCLPAYLLLANVVNSYLAGLNPPQLGLFVIDENNETSKDTEKALRALRITKDPFRLHQIVEKGFFIESHKSLPLQLCDLISFWCRRMEEEKLGRKTTDGDRAAFPIIKTMIFEGTGTWDVVDWLVKEMQKQK